MKPNRASEGTEAFVQLLRAFRHARREQHKVNRKIDRRRKMLTTTQRRTVLAKTAGRCHICGGAINGKWQADHVLAHSSGGEHIEDNYLPAHSLCNNYRWDYSAEEFQHILKLGVWIRHQIELQTSVGRLAAKRFIVHEANRIKRRKY